MADYLTEWLAEKALTAQDLRGADVALGEKWERWLYEELRRADEVVCVVTSASLASVQHSDMMGDPATVRTTSDVSYTETSFGVRGTRPAE
ncbi:MAG: hypothetical protein ACT4NY_26020 [Pseudonocardiales bacterium]